MPDDYAGDTSTTGTVSVDGSTPGNIEVTDDTDWFRITLTAGQTYRFDLQGSPSGQGTLADAFLRLRDSAGTSLTFDDDSGTGFDAQIDDYVASYSGTYYLSVGSGATPGGTGTYRVSATLITVDDTVLNISALDADKFEGTAATTAFTFTVTRSGNTSIASSVQWTIGANQSPAADASDFSGLTSNTLTWSADDTSARTITLAVIGDSVYEGGGLPEHFTVELSNPSGALIGTSIAVGHIQNDDPAPSVISGTASDGTSVSIRRIDDPNTAIDPTRETWVFVHGLDIKFDDAFDRTISTTNTTLYDEVLSQANGAQILAIEWDAAWDPSLNSWIDLEAVENRIPHVAAWAAYQLAHLRFAQAVLAARGHYPRASDDAMICSSCTSIASSIRLPQARDSKFPPAGLFGGSTSSL